MDVFILVCISEVKILGTLFVNLTWSNIDATSLVWKLSMDKMLNLNVETAYKCCTLKILPWELKSSPLLSITCRFLCTPLGLDFLIWMIYLANVERPVNYIYYKDLFAVQLIYSFCVVVPMFHGVNFFLLTSELAPCDSVYYLPGLLRCRFSH